jgi:hypothetical protein
MAELSEFRDNEPNEIVSIAATGDVILVVGPKKMKLRVQSMILKAISKPFSAMLDPGWKEGHDVRGADRPVELLLPEDNAIALKFICAITHCQNTMVPNTIAANDVLEVAVTTDKYDFVDALKFASKCWLHPLDKEAGELMVLTAAAYLFQNAQAFKEITKALILDYGGSYLALSSQAIESVMPWRVFCKYL